jgi:PAS domain S-box-containing protein
MVFRPLLCDHRWVENAAVLEESRTSRTTLRLGNGVLAVALAVLAVETAAAVELVLASEHEPHKTASIALAVTAGVSFVVSGLVALRRQPRNRTGLYLAAVGYLWFLGALPEANGNVVYTVGVLVSSLAFVPFAALVLAFPSGGLERLDRWIVKTTAWFVLIGPLLLQLVDNRPLNQCAVYVQAANCPSSAIVVYDSHTLASVIDDVATTIAVALIATIVVILVRRWRSASVTARRTLAPVYAAGAAALLALLLSNLVSPLTSAADDVLGPIFLVVFGTVPLAFLFGLLRSRLARGSVAELMLAIGHGTPLRAAISEALNDPSLELAYWLEEGRRFVDRDGSPLELTAAGATLVERDGRRVGALLHDPALVNEPELVESVSAAVALALDNERLQAELRSQVTYLRTILDATPSLVVGVDTDGRILALNRATLAVSGYGEQEAVVGRFFWDIFIDPEEREAMRQRFYAAAPIHPEAEYENTFTNARGERLTIAWRGAPVVDDSGQTARIVAGGIDITERKRRELELQWNIAHRKQQEEEIRASRARIVAAADDARRKLERNLHDGAQQRLVALSLALRLAQSKLTSDLEASGRILGEASSELAQALEELRELARGIHPALLTDRGLKAALQALSDRTPLPVELAVPDERLPRPLEAAAYYVVSESIANVIKHANASTVQVTVARNGDSVRIEVADDGVGGAEAPRGSGLRGLADRLAALDGTLDVDSPAGGGTRVVARAPLGAGG